MTAEQWFCCNCENVRDIDVHGRCVCCGSESICPAVQNLSSQSDALQMRRDQRAVDVILRREKCNLHTGGKS